MIDTTAPARTCFYVRFESAVHGGPVASPVYATSPREALAIFAAEGPAVRVLAVTGRDGIEHDPAELTDENVTDSGQGVTVTGGKYVGQIGVTEVVNTRDGWASVLLVGETWPVLVKVAHLTRRNG